ncbi:flavin reductase (DIM6/NTAB) family NADH-FMN oxidoreductase RutF [Anaerosolibacter carboniphilus]|uniref:Flavin reductase (DIM6/NTAB) family NADH-FMN oxidoreductase RutF n=1 Tax=Anaerosolibacter carboniphilus TaxID=1417629 RepID=A0A841KTR6_9FIRM|nr:flavin reductase family protein [Anaerosolibacter carboniphilus]MBB6217094.1 flavin reductase (DIM6/NTAB) family NADH-FMN oxidoreductase RutF [Anaerosolibacter carboniphilus]
MNDEQIKKGLRKIVNPVGLVVAKTDDKKDVTTVAWISKVSNDPPLIVVSIAPERYIHPLIEEAGEFVLALLSEEQEALALSCGTKTAYHIDKFDDVGIETQETQFVKGFHIKGAIANLECRVKDAVVAGDHTLFVAEVLAANYDESKRPLIMTNKMGTICY